MHGWWFPGRQLIVVLPAAVLLFAAWADRSGPGRFAALVFLGIPGLISFGFLVVEGLRRELTWVVDFASTVNPFYGMLSRILPDYLTPTAGTWVLHGLWVAVAVVLILVGWSSGSPDRGEPSTPDFEETANQERVFT